MNIERVRARIFDYGIALYVVFAFVMLIIPLSDWLLDILLAVDMSLSFAILFNAMYVKEVLELSNYPTILLIGTVFRVGLNVSSTRMILSTGNAGRVISVFGEFVGGGDLVIGIVVYIILVIVQLIVINKGSERVSEVTARFTLDAMPGKQMAIDADLNTGAITDQEAMARRQKLQDEASFFGSMDGATKYVKGDTTAGLIITGINIIGGIALGVLRQGMPIGEALDHYTILTIGDGLVSSIPSLLISLSTGILVTKGAKEADFGQSMMNQLFSMSKAMYLVGALIAFLGIVTPLPDVVYVAIGAVFIIIGRVMSGSMETARIEAEAEQEETTAEEIRQPENVTSLLQVDPIELEFGYGIIPLADVNQGGDLLDRVVMIRRQIALELGTVVPIIRLRDNIQLNPNQYIIKIKGIQTSEGEIMFDHYMAMNPGTVEEEIAGIKTKEPSYGLPAIWITESQRERAESRGYTVVDPPSIIATHLTEVIRRHIADLLTRQDVQNLINNLKENNQALVDELYPKLMGLGDIEKVLQNLLREGISIRDLVTIFETLADYAPSIHDPDLLTEYVRQALKRAISGKFFTPGMTNYVMVLAPELEQEIMASVKQTETGAFLTLNPDRVKAITDVTRAEAERMVQDNMNPIVLTSPIVRMYFKRLMEDVYSDLIVLSMNEVDPEIQIVSRGQIKV